jgi:hypothetical protein
VLRNRINLVADDTIQAAMVIGGSPPTSIVEGNIVRSLGTTAFSFGLRMGGSNILVRDNDIDPGMTAGGARGIATGGQGISQVVENNIVFGGNGPQTTTRSRSSMRPVPCRLRTVALNFLHGDRRRTTIGVGIGECPPAKFAVGRFTTNVIYGEGGTNRYAVVEHANVDFASPGTRPTGG